MTLVTLPRGREAKTSWAEDGAVDFGTHATHGTHGTPVRPSDRKNGGLPSIVSVLQ